eukprot:scaffold48_cov161-Amphora_coffeaeformis.AAC.6
MPSVTNEKLSDSGCATENGLCGSNDVIIHPKNFRTPHHINPKLQRATPRRTEQRSPSQETAKKESSSIIILH